MAKIFYLSEVLSFAVAKEQESYRLYENLANFAEGQNIKDVFYQLMQEEKQHEEFYTNLFNSIPHEQTAGVKEDDEYHAYVQELISASKTVQPLSLENNTGISKVIDYAIAREKDSILFYTGLKNLVPLYNQEQIRNIIR